MDSQWKQSFVEKLSDAQSSWSRKFDGVFEASFQPAFDELRPFLSDNGFSVSVPLREVGRRSYKFQLAENAYLLVILRSLLVGDFEVRCESFVPGAEPILKKSLARLADVNEKWAAGLLQEALDEFVMLLARDSGGGRGNFRERGAGEAKVENEELVLV